MSIFNRQPKHPSMKNLFTKLKWIAALGLVFGIVLMTNQVDKKNFEKIKGSMENLYQDRLLVKGYIFQLSTLLGEKTKALYTNDTAFFVTTNRSVNDSITIYLDRFFQTELVDHENRTLKAFDQKFDQLRKLEEGYVAGNQEKQTLLNQVSALEKDLKSLSKIQLEEGKRQLFIAKKSVDLIDLFTRIEIMILIFIAVVVQVIILYSPKKKRGYSER